MLQPRHILFTILITALAHSRSLGQTIPMNTDIMISVTKRDTLELGCYNVYYFTYKDKKARFIVDKLQDTARQYQHVTFCRNTTFCIKTKNGQRFLSASCGAYNGFGISGQPNEPDSIRFYDFNESSSFPTLRLCNP